MKAEVLACKDLFELRPLRCRPVEVVTAGLLLAGTSVSPLLAQFDATLARVKGASTFDELQTLPVR